MAGTSNQLSLCTESSIERNVAHLLYGFDRENPWKHFTGGHASLSSSVERGTKKQRTKLKKIYLKRERTITTRKNRAYADLTRMSLLCSCNQGCLMRPGAIEARQIIRQQRNKLFQKSYIEQNYILSKLMEVRLCPSGLRRIRYHIQDLEQVCKGAFERCYGLSDAKIKVLLKKMDADGLSMEGDQRGKHGNYPRKIVPEARKAVVDFMLSHSATESHYRRARTRKRYFESHISMHNMWTDFIAKHPDFKTSFACANRKGPGISYSKFREIFIEDLSDIISFRKARVDTCQLCDQYQKKMKQEAVDCSRLQRYADEQQEHLLENEVRFASLKYDVIILAKTRDRNEAD